MTLQSRCERVLSVEGRAVAAARRAVRERRVNFILLEEGVVPKVVRVVTLPDIVMEYVFDYICDLDRCTEECVGIHPSCHRHCTKDVEPCTTMYRILPRWNVSLSHRIELVSRCRLFSPLGGSPIKSNQKSSWRRDVHTSQDQEAAF